MKPRFRVWTLLAFVIAIVGIAIGAADVPNDPLKRLPDGYDSTFVAEQAEKIPGDESSVAIAVFSFSDPSALGPLQKKAADLGGPLIPAQSGKAAMVPIEVPAGTASDEADVASQLRDKARADLPEGTTVQVTGPAAIQADIAQVFSGANFLLLSVTAAIVAVLLLVTYRSPILWLIPLTVIGLADRLAGVLFTHLLSATHNTWDESTTGILSVLVFGAGTNYALLLISRYRDELHHHTDCFDAMHAAWLPTVKAVLASAVTVMLGLLCLLLSVVPPTRGLGLACAFGVVVAASFALGALPGALVLFGRWIFWPRVPREGTPSKAGIWERIGGFVRGRATPIMVVSVLALLLAASPLLGARVGLSTSEQFLKTPESIEATTTLESEFPDADASPKSVWTADVQRTTAEVEKLGGKVMGSRDGEGYSILQVAGPDTTELRDHLTDAKVGGPEAENEDSIAAAERDQKVVFPLLAMLVTIALAVLLRSLVAPLIMVSTVILTYFAAMGLAWLVFRTFLGFPALAETTPLYAFVFLVALGVDYNIFLVSRTREEAEEQPTSEAILTSLAATGGVITSAGILLAAVFAALGVLPLVVMAQLGIVIFIGMLLDTLLVRTILVPAIVVKLGERFWLPARVRRE